MKTAFKAPHVVTESAPDPNGTHALVTLGSDWEKHKSQAYWDYREAWANIPRDRLETEFPVHLDIETTTKCNLLCPMCPRTMMLEAGTFAEDNGFLKDEDFSNIIDQAVAGGALSIKLNYLGEPLLHKSIYWQISYAKEKGILDVIMNTNATALTKVNSKRLLEAGLDGLFVSLDAINPRDYEKQRVGSSLGKVIDNLYEFIKLRNEFRPDCRTRINMVMYEDPRWMEQYKAFQVMWRGLADAIGYGWFAEHSDSATNEYPEVPGFSCAQPFHRMFVKYCGNVTVCCMDSADEMPMGNWRKQPLKEIWQGAVYREVREKHRCGEYRDIGMCRRCYFPVSAKRGSPAESMRRS